MIGIYEYSIWGFSVALAFLTGYLFAWYQIWYKKFKKTKK